MNEQYYIGWDVGGWNCDQNPNSRDAIVILDTKLNLLGLPWRGNLRDTINQADTTQVFIEKLFGLCGLTLKDYAQHQYVMAIDTPLGFSEGFRALINQLEPVSQIHASATNDYLYRHTEKTLFERGLKPLSAIKDMIGSQATKGMHMLAKFAPKLHQTGIWGQGTPLKAFEGYPSACKHAKFIQNLLNQHFKFVKAVEPETTAQSQNTANSDIDEYINEIRSPDQRDALICALLAWSLVHHPEQLLWPSESTPPKEGWIFVPVDGLGV
ncbi:DUF429 domain-containing protein [Thiomicrospira microaerophila]|uniref:DUF429 domain-containing protein n=1 Tax=Thiomicrospira microaerophila TaxID=406020 RepID=UPI0005C91616|nr:DUF429 domain-containing protein [Thiomicrospira microaerophila]